MRKEVFFLITALLILAIASPCFAAREKRKKEPEIEKNDESVDGKGIKYTGMKDKRDPFAVPGTVEKMLLRSDEVSAQAEEQKEIKIPAIKVQGIIWSKSHPQAIVDNRVLKVGEFIKDFEIKEITRNGIILFYKGKTFSVPVMGYEKKK
ncbi:MAG: general secretion pathway protein GspB [Candidatus Omnitrophota bacterium]